MLDADPAMLRRSTPVITRTSRAECLTRRYDEVVAQAGSAGLE
jgi:hypothetical protein